MVSITGGSMKTTFWKARHNSRLRGPSADPPVRAASMRVCASGFTLLELALVVTIGMVVTTISVPMTQTALKTYHLNTAVAALSGAIQTTRYQAISHGYHYNISFNSTSQAYQL